MHCELPVTYKALFTINLFTSGAMSSIMRHVGWTLIWNEMEETVCLWD